MRTSFVQRRLYSLAVPLALLFFGARTARAQTGTVTGRVTAEAGAPLPDVRVTVVGTSLVTGTNAEGRYTLRSVPAGAATVRVNRVGYQEQKKSVTVTAGQTATADFQMERAVVQLSTVVTTVTGEQRRVELGSAISTVNAEQRLQQAPVTDLASLLAAQAPGVQVAPGNTTGTGAKIRIRGVNSITLANDPIYIIDGVRMTSSNGSQSPNIFTGGAIQSRAQDINPEEIENIEIVKGPSAATLYGTDAANGVVVITTKRGHAGPTRYTAFGETGIIKDMNQYPTAYTLFGHAPAGSTRNCSRPSLSAVGSGTCVADSLTSFNLFENPNTTPLGTGHRANVGLQIAGGSANVRFFTSGEYEREAGVFQIPRFDVQRFDTTGVAILPEYRTPNELRRGSFRANLNLALSPRLDAAVSSGFVTIRSRLPQSDNNSLGLLSNAFGGPGYEFNGVNGANTISSLGYQLHGYRQTTPGESFQDVSTQFVNRFIGSTTLNYRPTSWLSARVDGGLDYAARADQQLCLRGNCPNVGSTRLGFATDDRAFIRTSTVNGVATASFHPMDWLASKTSVGTQWVYNSFDRNGAQALNLPPGAATVTGGATQTTDASFDDSKTFGVFAEQQFGIRDRLFLTGALRSDQNSAFGTDFQNVVYPKASASWVVSDEPFFPRLPGVNELRLRAAYGASGVQPGANDALRYFAPTTTNVALQDQPGVLYATLGNKVLRPERAREFETGFDAKLFNSSSTVEFTYYHKTTTDALVGAVVPPSLGTGATTQRANLGSVRNTGFELGLHTQLIDRQAVSWNVGLSGSTNSNELLTLGTDAAGNPLPPQVFSTFRNQPGYPLFGYWQRKYTYNDADKNGIITVNEITVADSATFVGYSTPRYEAVLSSGLDLFNRVLHINALFDYKGGNKLLNGTERIRCQSRNNCRGAFDSTASLFQQARAVAVRETAARTQYGYFEDASFVRFRELSVSYVVPQRLARRLGGATSTSLTFAARNLHVWTNYTGIDPESNADAGSTANLASDFQTVPPPTYFILRLNLGF